MAGPWEKYSQVKTEVKQPSGSPWNKYKGGEQVVNPMTGDPEPVLDLQTAVDIPLKTLEGVGKVMGYPGGVLRTAVNAALAAPNSASNMVFAPQVYLGKKVLQYLADKGQIDLSKAYETGDFGRALIADAPRSGEVLKRMNVPEGPKVDFNNPITGNPTSISARDVAGFAEDTASDIAGVGLTSKLIKPIIKSVGASLVSGTTGLEKQVVLDYFSHPEWVLTDKELAKLGTSSAESVQAAIEKAIKGHVEDLNEILKVTDTPILKEKLLAPIKDAVSKLQTTGATSSDLKRASVLEDLYNEHAYNYAQTENGPVGIVGSDQGPMSAKDAFKLQGDLKKAANFGQETTLPKSSQLDVRNAGRDVYSTTNKELETATKGASQEVKDKITKLHALEDTLGGFDEAPDAMRTLRNLNKPSNLYTREALEEVAPGVAEDARKVAVTTAMREPSMVPLSSQGGTSTSRSLITGILGEIPGLNVAFSPMGYKYTAKLARPLLKAMGYSSNPYAITAYNLADEIENKDNTPR